MRYYQGDSRWAKLKYPTTTYNVMKSGCGCCACTSVVNLLLGKDKKRPSNLQPWMVQQGFAIAGKGTTWDGITKTLLHYGFDKVKKPDTMGEAWKILNSSRDHAGVLLLKAGTKGGVTWTSSGHYVAFDDYKYENKKHYFHTLDSSYRNNSGWFAYETTMKGLLPMIWIVELPDRYKTLQGMNIRKRPDPSSEKVGHVNKSTIVEGEKTGDWLKTKEGYIRIKGEKTYMKKVSR